jgi:FixJ family two-component response regulator
MTPSTSGPRTVQLVEVNDRERKLLQDILESLGLRVEGFTSLADRTAGSGECLLWSVDGVGSTWRDLDSVLAEMGEGTSVVLLGRDPPMPLVVRALKAGAVDVLCKPVEEQELRRAVNEAIERTDAERLHRMRILALRKRLERLTSREREVFDRLITGQLNKQVGAELGITERTVKAHRASILRKVGVGSVAELVRVATTLEFEGQHVTDRAATAGKQALGPLQEPTPLSA